MRERLIRSAHSAEPNVPISPFHKARDDGVKRPFAARKYIRVRGIEREAGTAILKREPHSLHGYARTKIVEDALKPAGDVSFAIHDREINCVASDHIAAANVGIRLRRINKR